MFEFLKGLNKEELAIGALFGASFFPWIGLYSIPIGAIFGLFWSLSGAGKGSFYRKVLIPIIATTIVYFITGGSVWALTGLLSMVVLRLGYGLPEPSASGDNGSSLGNAVMKALNISRSDLSDLQVERRLNLITRGIYFTLLELCFLPLFFITPLSYIISLLIMVVGSLLAVDKIEGVL